MKVVVIGGGAAGMIAAITAAKNNNEVILIEKTSSLGNKLKITGKGRCNLTFAGDIEDFKHNIVKNYKFMYSSFTKFDNNDVISFFNELGVKTKVERGGRVFPISDKAIDVVNALIDELKKLKVKIILNSSVKDIVTSNNCVKGIILNDERLIECDKCILSTGGKSYSKTGSSGDGYIIAKRLGHNIITISPGLVPLRSSNIICKNIQGLSLKNVSFSLIDISNNKIIYKDFGEMLFAHFGITGPVVLSSSSILSRIDKINEKIENKQIYAVIDLKPALDIQKLDNRICRDFEKYNNKEFKNSLNDLLPKKIIPEIIKLSGIDKNKKVNQITKNERQNLIKCIKELSIQIDGIMPLDLAIITCGGIDTKEIDPKTMQSKIVKGLYFAGEIIDVDALTGGFNLQIAFSTAVAAGNN